MKTALEVMTPEMARAWLENNNRNRRLRQSQVDKIARDILAGRWHPNHQSIGIAPTFIADGQHRLHAIVQAGIPVEVNVTYYDTDDEALSALLVVDKTATRSDADVQTLSGVMLKETAGKCVSIVKLWRVFGLPPGLDGIGASGKTAISNDEISALYVAEREHIDWAISTIFDPEAQKRFGTSQRAAFALGHKVDAATVERLAAQVVAADETQGSVALMWTKLASQGRFMISGTRSLSESFIISLRLIQAEILGQPPPQKMMPNKSTVQWFRDRLQKKPVDKKGSTVVDLHTTEPAASSVEPEPKKKKTAR